MEILTVMVVIGILVAIAVPILSEVREQARRTRAKAEVRLLAGQLRTALDTANAPSTVALTGELWTAEPCLKPAGRVLNQLPKTDPCWVSYLDTLEKLRVAGGVDVSDFADGDPWGSPYLIDENEGEGYSPFCHRRDYIKSVGPNGVDGGSPIDDIGMSVPRRKDTPDC